jgi:hypothetical protein
MKIFSVLLPVVLFSSFSIAQGGRPMPPGLRDAERTVEQGEKNVPPPLYQNPRVDLAKLKRDADELAKLAQTIPPSVVQTTKGVLPKDLSDRLKKIEKLAKQLRSQISQ